VGSRNWGVGNWSYELVVRVEFSEVHPEQIGASGLGRNKTAQPQKSWAASLHADRSTESSPVVLPTITDFSKRIPFRAELTARVPGIRAAIICILNSVRAVFRLR